MPPTRHRQWCIRQITGDAGSTARSQASKDQVVGSANRRGHQGFGTRPEGYQCHPPRDLLSQSKRTSEVSMRRITNAILVVTVIVFFGAIFSHNVQVARFGARQAAMTE